MEWLENRSCTGDTPELDKKNALKGKQGWFLDPDATASTKTSHRDGSQDDETENCPTVSDMDTSPAVSGSEYMMLL